MMATKPATHGKTQTVTSRHAQGEAPQRGPAGEKRKHSATGENLSDGGS